MLGQQTHSVDVAVQSILCMNLARCLPSGLSLFMHHPAAAAADCKMQSRKAMSILIF